MSFPRYPSYRDAGIQWLGEVPEHWAITPLGRVTAEKCDGPFGSGLKSEHYVESGVRVVRLQNIRAEGFDASDAVFVGEEYFQEELTRHDVRVGDVLIAGLGDERNSVGRACVAPSGIEPAMVKADCFRFRLQAERALPSFVALQLSAGADADGGMMATGSTRSRIPLSVMASRRLALPPTAEQGVIAAFVDSESTKIGTLVSEQQHLIELLNEKRHGVISRAVTKGLNPTAVMVPSGAEWIGEVPAHWRCQRNKAVFREVDRRSTADEGELLTVSHISGVTRRSEKEVNMFLAETLEGYKMCEPGDLVINTMWAWMGALGCSPYHGLVSPSYNVYRPRHDRVVSPRYYDYLCRIPAHRSAMKARSTGIWESRLRLYPDAFLSMMVALPPLPEQADIADFLDSELTKLDALVDESERAIELLGERRTTLTSAAVTGKIDVRGLAPAGPAAA